jgi:hypothetical protein
MYLRLKENKQLNFPQNGIIIQSGINNASPVLLVTSQSNALTNEGIQVRFNTEIYYNLEAKINGLHPIRTELFTVSEEVVSQFDEIPEGANSVTQLILFQIYSYLINIPLILPNGDISEEKLYKDWELIIDGN